MSYLIRVFVRELMTLALFAFGAYLGACGQIPVEITAINTPKTEATSSPSPTASPTPTYTPPATSANYCPWGLVKFAGFYGGQNYSCSSQTETITIDINVTRDIHVNGWSLVPGGDANQAITFSALDCKLTGISGAGLAYSSEYYEIEMNVQNYLIGFTDKNGSRYSCTYNF